MMKDIWLNDIQADAPFRFILAVSRPYRRPAILAILAVIAAATLGTVGPYAFKKVIDLLVAGNAGALGEVFFWAGLYIVLATVLAPVLWRLSGFAGMRWGVGVRATATHALTSYLTRHSYRYFNNRFAGAIGGKVGNASQAAKNIVEGFLWTHLSFAVSLVATLVLIFSSHALLGIVFIFWLIVTIPMNVFLARKRVPRSMATQAEDTKVRGRTIDLLTNVIAMHDFARRTFELEELKAFVRRRYDVGLANWRFGEWVRALNDLFEFVFVGGLILATVYLWSVGAATPGDVVLVLTLLAGIQHQISYLGNEINHFAERYGEVKEGLEEIMRPYEIVDVPYATDLKVTDGGIELINVSFGYEHDPLFSGLDLSIRPGEKVGLVGRSGAGKSTLVKLLLRQYDLTGGKILIDGQDIALMTQESVRDSISIIPQEPLLFHRSLKENIRYGNLDAAEARIIGAAKLAHAHAFIEKLPEKYETLVGERGVKLSGGQRQRIAIARAILKDSRILILDEATSALDSESEIAIQKALGELMRGKTVIAVAHRLSTLRTMDRIIVLDEGKIIEDGTHQELLHLGGTYAELWTHQAGGFLQDRDGSKKGEQTKPSSQRDAGDSSEETFIASRVEEAS